MFRQVRVRFTCPGQTGRLCCFLGEHIEVQLMKWNIPKVHGKSREEQMLSSYVRSPAGAHSASDPRSWLRHHAFRRHASLQACMRTSCTSPALTMDCLSLLPFPWTWSPSRYRSNRWSKLPGDTRPAPSVGSRCARSHQRWPGPGACRGRVGCQATLTQLSQHSSCASGLGTRAERQPLLGAKIRKLVELQGPGVGVVM